MVNKSTGMIASSMLLLLIFMTCSLHAQKQVLDFLPVQESKGEGIEESQIYYQFDFKSN